MKTTIEVHADNYLHELERITKERAQVHVFPDGECAVCGSEDRVIHRNVRSSKLITDRDIPLCEDCGSKLDRTTVDELFRNIKENEFFLWTKIVTHNIRKDNWISRLTFEILRE